MQDIHHTSSSGMIAAPSSQAKVTSQAHQVPSSQEAQEALIPSSSRPQAQQQVHGTAVQIHIPPPLWTDQFACDVTTSIQQKVNVVLQNGNLPPQSNTLFCDTLTPFDIVQHRSSSSSFQASSDNDNSENENNIDDLLGSGAFSIVKRVSIRQMNNKNKNSQSQQPSQLQYNQQYFALKSLKRDLLPEVLQESSSLSTAEYEEVDTTTAAIAGFVKAATELAREAYLLSRFDHPHIISIKGWTLGDVSSYQQYKRHDAFFLLLELLEKENLKDRIARWNAEEDNQNNSKTTTHHIQHTQHIQHERKVEQLTICRQVANALEYIHSKNVVYRDLKPQNIGFGLSPCSIQEEVAGASNSHNKKTIRVKLMDFGLARELPTKTINSNFSSRQARIVPNQDEQRQNNNNDYNNMKLFDMTGTVGTIRYMSPELYLNQPYGVEADIYSWSIVSYEILSKTCPYNNMTPSCYHSLVSQQGVRPNSWHRNQMNQTNQQGKQQQGDQHQEGNQLPSEYLVLLANVWCTNPANRLPLNRIQRQLDLFIQLEKLMYEAQQLVTSLPANNDNLLRQSFSHDNIRITTGQKGQQRQMYCGSSACVSSCGHKRSRFVDNTTNNNCNANATFPTQAASMNGTTVPTRMMNMHHHNNIYYQQRHCDVMNAARNPFSNDSIISNRPQLQRSQSQSNFGSDRSINRPQQQQK